MWMMGYKYFDEIQNVMRTGGQYILQKISEFLKVIRCQNFEEKTTDFDENALPMFLIVCMKFNNFPMRLLCNSDNMHSLIKTYY